MVVVCHDVLVRHSLFRRLPAWANASRMQHAVVRGRNYTFTLGVDFSALWFGQAATEGVWDLYLDAGQE